MRDKQAYIRKVEFDDVAVHFPSVIPWDEKINQNIDVFIVALGFEDRATAIAKRIAESIVGAEVHRSALGVLCCYKTNLDDNERNRSLLTTALATFCHSQVSLDAQSPQDIEKFLGDKINELSETNAQINVVFDISAASGNLILSVMHALIKYSSRISLKVLYAEPMTYFPKQDEYDRDPESLVLKACDSGNIDSPHEYGVDDVQINELYPGSEGESKPEFIIAVPAHRSNRLVRCIQHIGDQPLSSPDSGIHWILGEPPETKLKWRLHLQKRLVNNVLSSLVGFNPTDNLAPKLNEKNHSICSTRNYLDILKVIIQQSDNKIGYHINLIHMGSKLQAIGIGLALSARDEISICSANPTQFNASKYSEGIGSFWSLDLSNLNSLINNLKTVGYLRFTPNIETERSGIPAPLPQVMN